MNTRMMQADSEKEDTSSSLLSAPDFNEEREYDVDIINDSKSSQKRKPRCFTYENSSPPKSLKVSDLQFVSCEILEGADPEGTVQLRVYEEDSETTTCSEMYDEMYSQESKRTPVESTTDENNSSQKDLISEQESSTACNSQVTDSSKTNDIPSRAEKQPDNYVSNNGERYPFPEEDKGSNSVVDLQNLLAGSDIRCINDHNGRLSTTTPQSTNQENPWFDCLFTTSTLAMNSAGAAPAIYAMPTSASAIQSNFVQTMSQFAPSMVYNSIIEQHHGQPLLSPMVSNHSHHEQFIPQVYSTNAAQQASVGGKLVCTPHPKSGSYMFFVTHATDADTDIGQKNVNMPGKPVAKTKVVTCNSLLGQSSNSRVNLNSSGEEVQESPRDPLDSPLNTPDEKDRDDNPAEGRTGNKDRIFGPVPILNLNSSGEEASSIPDPLESSSEMNSKGTADVPTKTTETTPLSGRGKSRRVSSVVDSTCINIPFFKPEDDQSRHQHNQKERRRRARIKDACDLMRQLVPGMSVKTDKATVFEFAARYIHYLKTFVGSQHDKDFLMKYSPY
ncbi:hypothetical protein CHS0354_013702 [Potamilus streckersoni]|uniref:BHLH domain-containing protein n=1 Tax=Potamilus streckersoni TaxID=2493646 RepID=A0AAE0SY05_9BIVA|nr:hypothetical protein CHS0354_013702 [Potamilus streckersoni]